MTWDLWYLWNLHTAYYAYSINLAVGVGQFWSVLTLCDVAMMNCLWPFDQHVSYNTLNPLATEMNRCILWFSTRSWYITLKMCNGYPRKKGGKSGNWSYYLGMSQNVGIRGVGCLWKGGLAAIFHQAKSLHCHPETLTTSVAGMVSSMAWSMVDPWWTQVWVMFRLWWCRTSQNGGVHQQKWSGNSEKNI